MNNKKVDSVVFYTNVVLIFTNVWVFLYTSLIDFFNFSFPPHVTETFYREAVSFPEPYEMPLYIMLSFLGVLGLYIFCRIIPFILQKLKQTTAFRNPSIRLINYILFFLLATLFLTKLSAYPLAHEAYPYTIRSNNSFYYLSILFYALTVAVLTFELAVYEKFARKNRILSALLFIAVSFIAAIFTFEARFPISPHDYGYFFGPVYEVIQGKTLFTNAYTDYGFYATLFFALLYKLRLFDFPQLPVFIWFLFIVQYTICFYLIYKVSRSAVLALLGFFAIITINYFSYSVLPITIPQYSAMRRLPSILLLFIFFKVKKIDSKVLIASVCLVDFWIVDVGVSIVLAYSAFLFVSLLSKQISLKRFFIAIATLIFFQAGVFLLINSVHILAGYQPISLAKVFHSLRLHAGTGLTMIPIDFNNFFWVFVFVFFASVLVYFRHVSTITQLIMFNGMLTLFNVLYFVGRSHPTNMLDNSTLFVLNCFLILSQLLKHVEKKYAKLAVYITLFVVFIVFPVYFRRYTLPELIIEQYNRIRAGNVFGLQVKADLVREFEHEKKLILKHIPEESALILDREDVFLFITTGKKNLLNVNPQSAIDTVSEMQFATKDVVRICPETIAVDCQVVSKCKEHKTYSKKDWYMAPFILKEVQEKCGAKYIPTVCTEKLCIAKKEAL